MMASAIIEFAKASGVTNPLNPVLYGRLQMFIFNQWKLPSMMIGFGMFLLFERAHFQCKAVNWLAKSAFAIYLISMYPTVIDLLWKHLFVISEHYDAMFILWALAVVIGVCLACILLDLPRRALFALTVDRHKGH